jgi:hypothetical protein
VPSLWGDVNIDLGVAPSDVGDVKQRLGQLVSVLNLWYDVNADGSIAASDVGDVKQGLGNVAANCP